MGIEFKFYENLESLDNPSAKTVLQHDLVDDIQHGVIGALISSTEPRLFLPVDEMPLKEFPLFAFSLQTPPDGYRLNINGEKITKTWLQMFKTNNCHGVGLIGPYFADNKTIMKMQKMLTKSGLICEPYMAIGLSQSTRNTAENIGALFATHDSNTDAILCMDDTFAPALSRGVIKYKPKGKKLMLISVCNFPLAEPIRDAILIGPDIQDSIKRMAQQILSHIPGKPRKFKDILCKTLITDQIPTP